MTEPLPPDLRAALDSSVGTDFNASYTGRDLRGCAFDWLDVRDLNFRAAGLAGASFKGANMSGVSFSEADISHGVFDDARLHKTQCYRTRLPAASFVGATLVRVEFRGADLQDADFSQASLLAVTFDRARLTHACLRDAVLQTVSLTEADLAGLDVTGARFHDVWLGGAVRLDEVRAEWIVVGDEHFHERLEGARAREWLHEMAQFRVSAAVRWSHAEQSWRREPELVPSAQRQLQALLGSGQVEAPFVGVRLTRSAVEWLLAHRASTDGVLDLRGADLRGADLRGADLRGADLGGLPLRGVVGGLAPGAWDAATAEERERFAARFDGVSFQAAQLDDATLVGAHVERADLWAHLDRANLAHAFLTDANVRLLSAQGACFDETSADGVNAFMGDLRGSSWRGASLVGACFDYAKLDGVDFSGADLRAATFKGGSTDGTRFPG